MKTRQKKQSYRIRYRKMTENLSAISQMRPRGQYMYRLMDTVIFHDFETALDGVIEDFKEAHNDNYKQQK